MTHKFTSLPLEYALRDFFGVIDSPISVDAATLAKALEEIATEDDLDLAATNILRAIVAALTDFRAEWQLTLQNRRSGTRPLLHDRRERDSRDIDIVIEVKEALGRGDRKEAAVRAVMAARKISRSAVFEALKRHREKEAHFKRLRDVLDAI